MPENNTDARPALDLTALREEHAYPADGWCHTCETEIAPCPIARLVAAYGALAHELQDARSEIVRHHADFATWEGYAEEGLASLAERKRLRVVADAALKITYAMDLRAGPDADEAAYKRVEKEHGGAAAVAYWEICRALEGKSE